MENTASTQPQVGNNTGLFLGIGLVIAFLVIAYLVTKSKDKAATPSSPTIKPDEKPDEPAAPKDPPHYKRVETPLTFDLAAETDYQYYADSMKRKGYGDEYILYGAAFLKGMDLPINDYWAVICKKDIQDFVKKSPIKIVKKANWLETVRNFPYLPNDLVREVTTLTQLHLTPRHHSPLPPPQ
jgi:hypothetical protein